MLADVSHELKTPLTAMRACVETLRAQDVTLDGDTRERDLATLERENNQIGSHRKGLLDLSRLESGVTVASALLPRSASIHTRLSTHDMPQDE